MSAPAQDPPRPAPVAGESPKGAFRFPKTRRIRDRRDYQRIQNRGVRLGASHFLVMAMRQPGPPQPARLGITASKKSGESVARSRIKRLVREAFRLNPGVFPDGWDFVVIAREGADQLALTEVVAQLRGALQKLHHGGGQRSQGGGGRGGPPRGKQPGPRKGGPPSGKTPREQGTPSS
ncbi:MAG: ribonuclease P protein component [Myxococcota bacterium]